MSDVYGTGSESALIGQRVTYWTEELRKATTAFNKWYHDNTLTSWGTGIDVVSYNVDKMAADARMALQKAYSYPSAARFDSQMRILVEGIYAQISEPAPKWTDPVWETASDTEDALKPVGDALGDALKWGSGGVGLGLVLLAVGYVLWKRL